MGLRVDIFAIVATGVLLIGVLELVRSRRLLERYAILWLFAAFVLLVLGIWTGLLKAIATAVGIYYPPTALFVIAFGFVLVLLLHFSVAVSRLAEQSKLLAQRVALLEEQQRSLKDELVEARRAARGDELDMTESPEAEVRERV